MTTNLAAQAAVPHAGASAEWANSSSSNVEANGEAQSQVFQLAINYGTGSMTLEVGGLHTLSKQASSSYEDGLPVSGTYSDGSVKQLRTVASTLIPYKGRAFVLGIGLENLEIGVSGSQMSKYGGTLGSLHMNSLILEIGALRNFNRWGQALVSMSYDHALGGKLRSRYLIRNTRIDAEPTYAVIDDILGSAARLSITGNYQFNLLPGFSFGIFTAAQYGSIKFVERSERSYLYGYTMGLSFLLKI